MQRDATGRFLVITEDRSQVAVFSAQGRLIRVLGRLGSGPGEFSGRAIDQISVGPADTLYVFSNNVQFVDLFAPSLTFARRFRISATAIRTPHVMRNGQVLFSGRISTPERVGLPIHLANRNGEILRSFGDSAVRIGPGTPAASPFSFILSPDEQSVWTVEDDYAIRERRLDGRPGLSYVITDVPGLTPPRMVTTTSRGVSVQREQSTSAVTRGRIDANGHLWVTVSPGLDQPGDRRHRLEVFDTRAGGVIATLERPEYFTFIDKTNLAFSYTTSPTGVVTTIQIWELTLVR
jgi:hypothetical protein